MTEEFGLLRDRPREVRSNMHCSPLLMAVESMSQDPSPVKMESWRGGLSGYTTTLKHAVSTSTQLGEEPADFTCAPRGGSQTHVKSAGLASWAEYHILDFLRVWYNHDDHGHAVRQGYVVNMAVGTHKSSHILEPYLTVQRKGEREWWRAP